MSTGMETLAEFNESVQALREHSCKDAMLLKCTSTYPATPENSDVRTILHMPELFGCEAGLSDHTMGVGATVSHGTTVIGQHLTLAPQVPQLTT